MKTKMITGMAVMAALSVILVAVVHFPIFPVMAFLEYDPADIPILIGSFTYGTVPGIIITAVASAFQALLVSPGSGIYGFIMHVISTSVLVTVTSAVFRRTENRGIRILSLFLGTLAMTGAMVIANHFITPYFMGVPTKDVDAMLIPVIAPFNLIKAGVNSLVSYLVYSIIGRFIKTE